MNNRVSSQFSKKTQKHIKVLSIICVAIVVVFTLAGCNVIAALYTALIDPFIPEPTVSAEHNMKNTTLLIWVEDISTTDKNPILRRELTLHLIAELEKHKAVRSIIDYDKIKRFRWQKPEFSQMSIKQLGQQLHADEVLYVLIDKFQLRHEAGVGFYQASITGHCKIIDPETGNRLWPQAESNRAFTLTEELQQGKGQPFENRLIKEISKNTAQQIAQAFYKHKKS